MMNGHPSFMFALLLALVLVIDSGASDSQLTTDNSQPTTARLRIDRHNDYNPLDLHAIASTVGIWWNTRFTRMGDVALDTLLPGPLHRPIESTLETMRQKYHSYGLSSYTPTRRVGDLFKALLLHELSPSNITLGSQLQRTLGLIDWAQVVVADCGDLVARPFGGGAMTVLKYPYWTIDFAEESVDRAVHHVAIFAGRIADGLLLRIEHVADSRQRVPVAAGADEELVFSK